MPIRSGSERISTVLLPQLLTATSPKIDVQAMREVVALERVHGLERLAIENQDLVAVLIGDENLAVVQHGIVEMGGLEKPLADDGRMYWSIHSRESRKICLQAVASVFRLTISPQFSSPF